MMDAIIKKLELDRQYIQHFVNELDGRAGGLPSGYLEARQAELAAHDRAIAVLRDWPRWAGLVEAAGKVDKPAALDYLNGNVLDDSKREEMYWNIRALLDAIPEEK